jgi:hypothetical protein
MLFTLNCTSSGSPATTVSWRKDGVLLTEGNTYHMTQLLHSGTSSTYFNLLEVNAGPYAVVGNYSCEVSNRLGSVTRNAVFGGNCSSTYLT